MPRKLKSWVWEHCVRSESGIEATCILCNEVFQTRGSTSVLNKHLLNVHTLTSGENEDDDIASKRRCTDMEVQDGVETMDCEVDVATGSEQIVDFSYAENSTDSQVVDETENLPNSSLMRPPTKRGRVRSVAAGARPDRPCNRDRTELITKALVKMIVVDMQPLSFVTDIGFRDFMKVVEPNYIVPCRQTIKNRLAYVYEQLSAKISAELSKVSVVAWTSDCWSSRSQDAYITVTMHYLDSNWMPQTYTLTTEELSERHTAANLTAKLKEITTKWNLDGKVSAVVTDNAQNAKKAVRELDGLFINSGVTCAAHSLQLCVTNALALKEVAAICDKASKVVAHFRHSNIASTTLEQKQEQLGVDKLKLIQSCITRWDSTFKMLERLVSNRNPVMNVLFDRSITTPTTAEKLEISEREWSIMEKLEKVLKPLQVATTVFCSDGHAPISIVRPIIFTLRDNHLCEVTGDGEIITRVKEILRNQLTSRFELTYDGVIGVNARQVASFLDPRYKDLMVESVSARDDIKLFVRGLCDDDTTDEFATESHATAMDFLFKTVPEQSNAKSQYDMFLTEPQVSHNLNPFKWWSERENRYPILAELARRYLCIPASSASSERVFSTAGNIVSPKRNCLLPENVNILVFLYQNRKLL